MNIVRFVKPNLAAGVGLMVLVAPSYFVIASALRQNAPGLSFLTSPIILLGALFIAFSLNSISILSFDFRNDKPRSSAFACRCASGTWRFRHCGAVANSHKHGPFQAFSIASHIKELPGVGGKNQSWPESERRTAAPRKARHAMSTNGHPIEGGYWLVPFARDPFLCKLQVTFVKRKVPEDLTEDLSVSKPSSARLLKHAESFRLMI